MCANENPRQTQGVQTSSLAALISKNAQEKNSALIHSERRASNLIPIEKAAQLEEVSVNSIKRIYYVCNNFRVFKNGKSWLVDPSWRRGGELALAIERLYFQALELAGGDYKLAVVLANGDRKKAAAIYMYIHRFNFKQYKKAFSFYLTLNEFLNRANR
jgi:hypothetical protein